MRRIMSVLTLVLAIISCEEKSDNLNEQIVGDWVDNSGHTISFSKDGSFVNHTFAYYVISGNYEIVDNILKCRNLQFTDILQPSDPNISFGGWGEFIDSEIRINKGLMESRGVFQLSPLGHDGSSINGKWTLENAAFDIQKVNGQHVVLYAGASIKTFEFAANTDSCYFTKQFVGTSHYDVAESLAISKDSSQIILEGGPFLNGVPLQWRLQDRKMYWYFTYEFTPYLTKK